ncbi:stress responsive a b barrel domain-containing protein [Stemphylium lycopersici]|nr:stress responsive a b barrel domain-containing protein [Stemphylium lycopersici]
MPKIVRLTLFKIGDQNTVQEAIKMYSTLAQDAKKDGKNYIQLAQANVPYEDQRSQGYNLVARCVLESLEDMKYFDENDEVHAKIKAHLKPQFTEMPLSVPGLRHVYENDDDSEANTHGIKHSNKLNMAPSHPPTTCKPTTEEIENRIAQTLASGPLSLQGIADAMWPWSKGHEDAIADVFERIVQRLGEGHDALWRLHPTHASAIAGESGVEKTSVEDASVEKNDTEQRKGSKMLISRLPHVEERTEEDGDDRNHVSPRQSAPSSTSSPSPPPSSLKEVSQQLGQTRSRAPSPISTASLSPPPSNLTSSLSSVPSPSPAPDSPSSPQSPASTSGTTSTISELSSSLSSTRSTPPPFADLEVVAAESEKQAWRLSLDPDLHHRRRRRLQRQ